MGLSAGPVASGGLCYNDSVLDAAGPELVSGVRRWWPEVARDLPWRDVRDPWAILVSETMAQQTQVARVVPKWEAFLARLPTPAAAAEAGVGAVVELWDGLGYNRRAVQLHGCAVAVVERHDGVVPDDLESLLALPGVGPYTARAVLAFAHERDVAVLDTNVGRVLARWVGRSLPPKDAQALADSLVPVDTGWEWNQAILDFGAMQCTKKNPDCAQCPVSTWCSWAGVGPDPAIGSAAVSRGQSRFEGSDRQGRGRLVAALRRGPVVDGVLADVMGWPEDHARAHRVAATLLDDGLAARQNGAWTLP